MKVTAEELIARWHGLAEGPDDDGLTAAERATLRTVTSRLSGSLGDSALLLSTPDGTTRSMKQFPPGEYYRRADVIALKDRAIVTFRKDIADLIRAQRGKPIEPENLAGLPVAGVIAALDRFEAVGNPQNLDVVRLAPQGKSKKERA